MSIFTIICACACVFKSSLTNSMNLNRESETKFSTWPLTDCEIMALNEPHLLVIYCSNKYSGSVYSLTSEHIEGNVTTSNRLSIKTTGSLGVGKCECCSEIFI